VLAADPPIDWAAITDQRLVAIFATRDSNMRPLWKERLSKLAKALMLFGSGHLPHGLTPAVAAAARQMPGGFGVASAVSRLRGALPRADVPIDLSDAALRRSGLRPGVVAGTGHSCARVERRLAAPPNSPLSDLTRGFIPGLRSSSQ